MGRRPGRSPVVIPLPVASNRESKVETRVEEDNPIKLVSWKLGKCGREGDLFRSNRFPPFILSLESTWVYFFQVLQKTRVKKYPYRLFYGRLIFLQLISVLFAFQESFKIIKIKTPFLT